MIAALLGNALLVAVLAPPLWVLTRLLRRPAVAHWLWVMLLIKLVTPPLFAVPVSVTSLALLVDRYIDAIGVGGALSPLLRWATSAADLRLVASAVWVAGSALAIWSMLRRAEAFRQVIAARGDFDPHACDMAERVDTGGFCFRTPPVLLVDAVHSPMLCGVGPCCWILFPRPLWRALPPAGRERLLAHELAHFRRGDCNVRLLEMVATAVFWWHPALWLARREIESAEEDCCDAIAANAGPRCYAEAMLTTLDFLSDPRSIQGAAASNLLRKRSAIEQRLTRIMRCGTATRVSPRGWCGIAVAAALLLPWMPLPVSDLPRGRPEQDQTSSIGSIDADMLPLQRGIRSSAPNA